MFPSETHYTILGLSPTATVDAIQERYKRLLMQFHGGAGYSFSPPACEHLLRLSRAYTTIRDPDLRRAYDEQLRKNAQVREELTMQSHGEKQGEDEEKNGNGERQRQEHGHDQTEEIQSSFPICHRPRETLYNISHLQNLLDDQENQRTCGQQLRADAQAQEDAALQSQREEDEEVAAEVKHERREQEQEQEETDEMQRRVFHPLRPRERPERLSLLHAPLHELQSRRAYESQASAEVKVRKRAAKKAEWERRKKEEEREKREEEQDRIEQMGRGRALSREDERRGRGRDRGDFEDEYEAYRRRMRRVQNIFSEGGVHVGEVGDGLGPD